MSDSSNSPGTATLTPAQVSAASVDASARPAAAESQAVQQRDMAAVAQPRSAQDAVMPEAAITDWFDAPRATPPQSDESAELDQIQMRVPRLVSRYLAISTAVLIAWLFLVLGELVLAGLPEGLGWFFWIMISALGFLVTERQFTPYYTIQSARERAGNLALVGLVCLALLLGSMILGVLLPEPLVTALMFGMLGVLALWQRIKRTRLLPDGGTKSTWAVTARLMVVAACSVAALVKALGRMD